MQLWGCGEDGEGSNPALGAGEDPQAGVGRVKEQTACDGSFYASTRLG